MGFFDSLKNAATSAVKSQVSHEANRAVNSAVNTAVNSAVNSATNAVAKSGNESVTFTFNMIPKSVADIQSFPEASLDTPFKTAALSVLCLLCFEENPDAVFEMMDFLNGPNEVTPYTKSFIRERLSGKYYKPYSFFKGATPENNYVPTQPLTITVSSNPYSYPEENWATMFVQSSGADSPRQIKLRKKPSTGQWFLNEIQCLSDIRVPVEADPWA